MLFTNDDDGEQYPSVYRILMELHTSLGSRHLFRMAVQDSFEVDAHLAKAVATKMGLQVRNELPPPPPPPQPPPKPALPPYEGPLP